MIPATRKLCVVLKTNTALCLPALVKFSRCLANFSYELADHLKKCRGPDQEKCRKECFGKCRPKTGCRGKCRKSASGLSVLVSTEARTPKHFFGTFLGTPFLAGTFRSTLFGTFPGRGLGTSLDGRQARKTLANFSLFARRFCGFRLFLCSPTRGECAMGQV